MVKHVDDFIEQLAKENEDFFGSLPDSETQYWGDHLEGKAAAESLKPRWFNELRGVEVIGRFIERVPDITLKVMLGRQVGDEAKHARVCRKRIEELGESVLDYIPSKESLAFGDLLDSFAYPEEFFSAQQFTVETQSLKRNELALSCFDQETAAMFAKHINPDEHFHVRLGYIGLQVFARTEAAQRRAQAAAQAVRGIHSDMVKKHRHNMTAMGLLDS